MPQECYPVVKGSADLPPESGDPSGGAEGQPSGHNGSPGLRILLVEDNAANQELIRFVLETGGHVVDSASNGAEALAMSDQRHYDLILMDIEIPCLDGMQVASAIRKREGEQARVPIIAMTAYALKEDHDLCLAAGMDDHLSKPIDPTAILALVERIATTRITHHCT
ncbi:MAG: response regulator [Planctomycetota bacterium]